MSRLSKDLIQQRFKQQLHDYRRNAVVQERMASQLADLTETLCADARLGRVFEIGAGSAGLTEALLSRVQVESYFANDLVAESAELVTEATEKYKVKKSHFLPGDVEQLIFPANLDLVVSGATLQWLTDLPRFFERIAAAMNDDACFCFSSFGPDNMTEIKQLTSIGLNYHSLEALRNLVAPWFDVEMMTEERYEIEFAGPEEVLRHVRKTGVNGLNRTPWSKSRHRAFVADYRKHFSSGDGVQLTYHSLYCCLRKKSQVNSVCNDPHGNDQLEEMEMAHGW